MLGVAVVALVPSPKFQAYEATAPNWAEEAEASKEVGVPTWPMSGRARLSV